jgi:RNA-directed DNA polymerase
MHDRAMQALYALALIPVAETWADPNSYAFREGRGCADALEHVYLVLCHKHSAQWVLEGDITACFDEISHPWVLQHLLMDKHILRKWLQAGYWEKGQLFPTSKGTPQGGVISPIIANIVLDGMQKALLQAVSKKGAKVNFVRYADDFVVTGASKELLEQKVKPAATAFLTPRGLELSEQKTVITHVSQGFNFLGHTVRKFGDKLLTTPAKRSLQALRDKIRLCINSAVAQPQEVLLRQLNPLIRGWANYYRHGAAKRTFDRLDNFVYRQLLRWAKRRHPDKSATWKQRKYFSAAKGLFSVRLSKEEGQSQVLTLYRAASTRIQRHIKIRGAANPYDPNYSRYFESRRRSRWRWSQSQGTASTPQTHRSTRIVAHWLGDAAECPHPGAPVREA